MAGFTTGGGTRASGSVTPRPTYDQQAGPAVASTVAPLPAVYGTGPCPMVDGSSPTTRQFPEAFAECIEAGKLYSAVIVTSKGEFKIQLDARGAPVAVNNFVALARFHYFDDTPCPAIYANLAAVCGVGDSQKGPGYTIADDVETPGGSLPAGAVAVLRNGPGLGGSAFFVLVGKAKPEGPHTVFGKVVGGLGTLATISALGSGDGRSTEPVSIVSVTITES